LFLPGERVLLRIPNPIVAAHIPNVDTLAGSGLPPTSNARSPQYFTFIRTVLLKPDGSVDVEVYPELSFHQSGGALSGYSELPEDARPAPIPLPPLSSRHPTPEAFGAPLTLGGWSNRQDAWLRVVPITFNVPETRPVRGCFIYTT
jgi:hypothetical protein